MIHFQWKMAFLLLQLGVHVLAMCPNHSQSLSHTSILSSTDLARVQVRVYIYISWCLLYVFQWSHNYLNTISDYDLHWFYFPRTFVCSKENLNSHFVPHNSTGWIASCIFLNYMFHISQTFPPSSANSSFPLCIGKFTNISFFISENKVWLLTLPWGVPLSTTCLFDSSNPILTWMDFAFRKSVIYKTLLQEICWPVIDHTHQFPYMWRQSNRPVDFWFIIILQMFLYWNNCCLLPSLQDSSFFTHFFSPSILKFFTMMEHISSFPGAVFPV